MDVNRALRTAAQTGTVVLGLKESLAAVNAKKAKLLVLAENAPKTTEALTAAAAKVGVPVYRFRGINTELGPAAGKPFSVAVMAVLEPGESDVLALAREE